MRLNLPNNPAASVRVTVRSNTWNTVTTVDRSFTYLDVQLPPGVSPDDVEAFAEFLNPAECVIEEIGAIVIKTKVRIPRGRLAPR